MFSFSMQYHLENNHVLSLNIEVSWGRHHSLPSILYQPQSLAHAAQELSELSLIWTNVNKVITIYFQFGQSLSLQTLSAE